MAIALLSAVVETDYSIARAPHATCSATHTESAVAAHRQAEAAAMDDQAAPDAEGDAEGDAAARASGALQALGAAADASSLRAALEAAEPLVESSAALEQEVIAAVARLARG